MADRFAHDPVARLEAAKAAQRDSLFTSHDSQPREPRTTAIEDVLIAQLVAARTERDRYEAALYRIVAMYGDRCEQRVGGAVAIAHEALEGDPT